MKALGHAFDFLLTFQVKGPSSRSDEAMGHLQDHIGSGAFGAFGERHPLNSVALSECNDFLALDVHDHLLDISVLLPCHPTASLYHAFRTV
jgi:hypothetical protein